MTTLIIARHGNTFEDGETPRRVGARTDLPLTAKGQAQAVALGHYLKEHRLDPAVAFCGPLRRAKETAALALAAASVSAPLRIDERLNEIDYGPDENKTEAAVEARIGAQALKDWDEEAIPPPDWNAQPVLLRQGWLDFGKDLTYKWPDVPVLAVTSNGVARFAPHLTGDFEGFRRAHPLKIATGALCILRWHEDKWRVTAWNVRPQLPVQP